MAAVPHLKDGYSSGFVVTTKDPLSQKAEPSRAFRASLSFFLCLSESVAQAFRGSKFHMHHGGGTTSTAPLSFSLSLLSSLSSNPSLTPRCVSLSFPVFFFLSLEREPQLTKATSPLVIRHAAVTVSSLFFVEKKKKTDNPIRTLFLSLSLSLFAARVNDNSVRFRDR